MNAEPSLRNEDAFVVGKESFTSRLILGTSRYPNPSIMLDAVAASGAEMVTVSIRRVNLTGNGGGSILDDLNGLRLLPNTAGCFTAPEAILTAELAREALGVNRIKVEVIGEEDTLLPDGAETIKASAELVRLGFEVYPYAPDDLVTCLRLQEVGVTAVMPLASPIGSGMGLQNPYNLSIIREKIEIPLIVDAGIGTASDAARAMELGADGVLLNSAVSSAHDPVRMARAMRYAVEGGRHAYLAGRMPTRRYAKASSPASGVIAFKHSTDEGGSA